MTLCAVLGSHSGVAEDLRLIQECDVVLISLEVMRVRSSFIYKGLEDEGTTVLRTAKNH